jgi:probable rRNA maturation factor
MAEVFAADEQAGSPAGTLDIARWARLADAVLEAEGLPEDAEMSLLFVEPEAMAELNSRFRSKQGPTDVLAFPMDSEDFDDDYDDTRPAGGSGRQPDGGTTGPTAGSDRRDTSRPPVVVGDVVICPEVAKANAADHAGPGHSGSVEDELALLVVHGVLHLLGMDHLVPEEAQAMEAREQQWLDRFHRQVPADG